MLRIIPHFRFRSVVLTFSLCFLACVRPATAETFTVPNVFGTKYEPQPLEFPLPKAEPDASAHVLDEQGQVVGQIAKDGMHALMHIGFEAGQQSRTFRIDRAAGIPPTHAVAMATKTWMPQPGEKTVRPNGVLDYYEITNGLIGVRVPKSLRPDALPPAGALQVPSPILGVSYGDGEWAGRPDFRSFIVPRKGNTSYYWDGEVREDWRFTGFQSEVVEQGPVQTTVRLTIQTNQRTEPYIYEVTVYAAEHFVKIAQETGRINDWVIDLNTFKPTWWRATRWRSGNHYLLSDYWGKTKDVALPDRPGATYNLVWTEGPGAKLQVANKGEAEGDLFSKDVWIDFDRGSAWGVDTIQQTSPPKYGLNLLGMLPFEPWTGLGSVLYAFNRDGGADSPVAGILNGPCSEITGWKSLNGYGEYQFFQHIPSWVQKMPYLWYGHIADWKYDSVGEANKDKPVQGVKVVMGMRKGSFFLWLGKNSDIEPDIEKINALPDKGLNYISPLWKDWARYTSGIVNLQDALSYTSDWPDPPQQGKQYIESSAVEYNKAQLRAGRELGYSHHWRFLHSWAATDSKTKIDEVDEYIKQQVNQWINPGIARVQAGGAFRLDNPLCVAWYVGDRAATTELDTLESFFALGRIKDGGLLDDERWDKLKQLAAFYAHTIFDEDRSCYWNEDTIAGGHGGGTMTALADGARFAVIQQFPQWSDSLKYARRPVLMAEQSVQADIGRYGAQFTGTGYGSGPGIIPGLANLLALQYRSYTPDGAVVFPDEFARDPRLRHYAYFVMNRMSVKDPRYLDQRMPIAVGNSNSGNGVPAAALLSSGFRHIDPVLSRQLFWTWDTSRAATFTASAPLPKIVRWDLEKPPIGGDPYPFPLVATFPGNMTMHRQSPYTPNETGVYIMDGSFFNQHRESNESGEVHIDALGKPLVTNSLSYSSPQENHPFYKNVISPITEKWDADNTYLGRHDVWNQWLDHVNAIGSWSGPEYAASYSSSGFYGAEDKALNWTRQIVTVTIDKELPLIFIRDSLSKPGDYVSTFWLQTEGPIQLLGGDTYTPKFKSCPLENGIVPSPEQSPSCVRVPGTLAPGVHTMRFNGHNWMKLYAKSYEKAGIKDVGPDVDVDVHSINTGPIEMAVGQWRIQSTIAQTALDRSPDDKQYLRVKFHGASHVTLFSPYFRGKLPADYKVQSGTDDTMTVTYSMAGQPSRKLIFTPTKLELFVGKTLLKSMEYPTSLPTKLYPEWKDFPYGGQLNGLGSPLPTVEVKGAPVWANGIYEKVPHRNVSEMLHRIDGVADPLARLGKGTALANDRAAYRATFGDRMAYLIPLAKRGWALARLPGKIGEGWLEACIASQPEAATGWMALSGQGTKLPGDLQVTVSETKSP